MPEPGNPSQHRAQRRAYRTQVLDALASMGFEPAGKPVAGRESGFFSADFAYPSQFAPARGLRPHLRIEMTFEAPALRPVERPIRSLIAQVCGHAPEVPAFPCIDPVETAADKLSALAWRACARDRSFPAGTTRRSSGTCTIWQHWKRVPPHRRRFRLW